MTALMTDTVIDTAAPSRVSRRRPSPRWIAFGTIVVLAGGATIGVAALSGSTAGSSVASGTSIHGIAEAVASGDLPRRGGTHVLAATGGTPVSPEARQGHGPAVDVVLDAVPTSEPSAAAADLRARRLRSTS
jgi:hypothetical protein